MPQRTGNSKLLYLVIDVKAAAASLNEIIANMQTNINALATCFLSSTSHSSSDLASLVNVMRSELIKMKDKMHAIVVHRYEVCEVDLAIKPLFLSMSALTDFYIDYVKIIHKQEYHQFKQIQLMLITHKIDTLIIDWHKYMGFLREDMKATALPQTSESLPYETSTAQVLSAMRSAAVSSGLQLQDISPAIVVTDIVSVDETDKDQQVDVEKIESPYYYRFCNIL